MRPHKTLVGLMTLLFALFIESEGLARAPIKLGIPIPIHHMDPFDLEYLEEWEIFAGVHDTLLEYQVMSGFKGLIAESWKFDPSRKTITFYLRPGLTFSDGSPLTANDVEFTLKRLIRLDHARTLVLSRCLRDKSFSDLNKSHRLIKVLDQRTLQVGPTDCKEVLLKEMADANHGIISQANTSASGRLKPNSPVSGAFTYSETSDGLILNPNLRNWRWQGIKSTDRIPSIKVISTQAIAGSPLGALPDLDAFRTANPEVLKAAKSAGYQALFSLPAMSWYLRPAPRGKVDWSAWSQLIHDINERLDRSSIHAWKENPIEFPADTFFPREMNCDSPVAGSIKRLATSPRSQAKYSLRLIEHPSGESKIFSQDLKSQLESLGFRVELTAKRGLSKHSKTDAYEFFIERQFLGDSTTNVLNMVMLSFRFIPDPGNIITRRLKQIESMEKSGTSSKTLTEACAQFHHYYHIPLAHRRYAYLYKDPSLSSLFSKGNGNIVINSLTETLKREQ